MMEYHIWYTSPFGPEGRGGWIHWDHSSPQRKASYNPEIPFGNTWRRYNGSIGYPLVGFYDSSSREIIRWQIRCMKAAGLDGSFVQLFPIWNGSTTYGDQDTIFRAALDIAAEENYHLGIHDEVQFMGRSPTAQNPDVCAERIGSVMKTYGGHPGFLKIDGKPAIQFQAWDLWAGKLSYPDLARIMKQAEQIAGRPIYWIPMAFPSPELLAIPEVRAIVPTAVNGTMIRVTGSYAEGAEPDWDTAERVKLAPARLWHAATQEKGLGWWTWGYYGCNNSARYPDNPGWLNRRGGRTLVELLDRCAREKPDAILLSSWNDWVENTALEPGLAFDDYNGDPYLYCRIIAAARGRQFVPPPLPPAEAVDPWIRARLYGIDRTPPAITGICVSPLEPAIEAFAADEDSTVAGVRALPYGNGLVSFDGTPRTHRARLDSPAPAAAAYTTADGRAGLLLDKNNAVQITFTEPALKPELADDIWLHVYFFDGQAGSVTIRYPASPDKIITPYVFPAEGKITCLVTNRWREFPVKLRQVVNLHDAPPFRLERMK